MTNQKINKKADVQMVSYVVLIVISLSLSVLVYSFLKSKTCIFSCAEKCPDEVSIIIEDAICQSNELKLTVSNRGLFNISLLYVRMGNETKKIPFQINKNQTSLLSPLPPGGDGAYIYTIPSDLQGTGEYFVEVQPALLSQKRTQMLCNSRPRQTVNCIVPSEPNYILLTNCPTILDQANKIYKLQKDLISDSTCFTITKKNITLDGQGHTINGISRVNNPSGIRVDGDADIIRDIVIKNFYRGILVNSKNNTLINNNVSLSAYGVMINDADNNNNLTNNRLCDNNQDLSCFNSQDLTMGSGNIFNSNNCPRIQNISSCP